MAVEYKGKGKQQNSSERQSHKSDRVNEANSAITTLVGAEVQGVAASIQKIDASLNGFEERFSDSLVERIDQIGARIWVKTTQKLAERRSGKADVAYAVDMAIAEEIDVPFFEIPALPKICPSSEFGCLPT